MIAAAKPKPVADEGLGPFETLDSWRTSRNKFMSSAYLPALVRKRTSSHRRSGLPIPCGAIWCRNPKRHRFPSLLALPVYRGASVAFLHAKRVAMFLQMSTTRSRPEPRTPDRCG